MRDAPDVPELAISSDLHCYACGYNLRGIDPAGACPECGSPARDTLDGRAVRARLLRIVRRGSMLLGGAMALGVAAAAITLTVNGWAMLLLPLSAALGALGTWQFAVRPTPRRWQITFLRVAGIVTLLVQMQFVGILIWHSATASPLDHGTVRFSIYPLLLAWSVAAAATCWHASTIARDVGDFSGLVQARLLAVLAPATVLGAAVPVEVVMGGNTLLPTLMVWGASAFAVAGWCAVYFLGFAVVLGRAIRVAA